MTADLVWIIRTPEYGGCDRPRDKRERPAELGPRPWETSAA